MDDFPAFGVQPDTHLFSAKTFHTAHRCLNPSPSRFARRLHDPGVSTSIDAKLPAAVPPATGAASGDRSLEKALESGVWGRRV